MPRYEYLCEKCQKPFELTMTIAEHEKGKVRCPTCKSTKVVPQLGAFCVILRLSLTTAELVGENAAEWQALEELVRLGQRTSAPRTEEWRLRGLATRLKVPLRVPAL
jgi:putative FmdB family regulatory protein